jgi:hypothetical protein
MSVELGRDLIRTQDQMGPRDTSNLVFKLFNAQIPKVYATVKRTTQNIGHAFTVGHAVNGIVGTANGVDGSQILIGSAYLAAESDPETIVSTENTFVEGLRDTEYIDTTLTTATVNTTTFKVTF